MIERPIRERPEWRQVYFVEAEGLGLVKIGSADRVKRRLAELQTGSPVALKVRGVFHTDDASGLEARLHRTYAHLRQHGEWFRLEGELADMSLGCGEADEEPLVRMVQHPRRHAPFEPAITIHWRGDDTTESFSSRAFTVLHALDPERFIVDELTPSGA